MSLDVFPELPSQIWPVVREPVWDGVHIEETANGREFRSSASTYPRQSYTLRYSALNAGNYEAQRLIDFFNSRGAGLDYFYFRDRDDDRVTLQQLAVTDGTTTDWQLGRAMGNLPMNLLDFSGSLNSGWGLNEVTRSYGYPSRDTLDASLLVESTTAGVAHYINKNAVTVVPGQDHTFAAKFMPAGRKKARMIVYDHVTATQIGYADIDLMTGLYTTSGSVDDAGALSLRDGMRLAWVTVPVGSTIASCRVRAQILRDDGTAAYAGDGVSGLWIADAEFYRGGFLGAPTQRSISANPPVQFLAPVFDLAGAPSIYLADAGGVTLQTSGYTVSATGALSFAAAPAAGKALLWSGGYYQRCRFVDRSLSVDQFTRRLFSAQSLKLITVKP